MKLIPRGDQGDIEIIVVKRKHWLSRALTGIIRTFAVIATMVITWVFSGLADAFSKFFLN